MSYYPTFLKSLGISIGAVGIPSLFFYPSFQERIINFQSPEKDELYNTPIYQTIHSRNPGERELSKEEIRVKINGLMDENEFCPKEPNNERRNFQYCAILKEIINILDEIKDGFSQRVYLKLPTKENVSIPLRKVLLDKSTDAQETFNYYFKPHEYLSGERRQDFIFYLWRWLSPKPGYGLEKHTRNKLHEIREFFPDIQPGHYHKWRYVAILKRLAENGDIVHLRPIKMFEYYSLFRSPWKLVLLVEEAQYFYISGGSEWAGWKDRKYIYSFKDALNTYIPKKTR